MENEELLIVEAGGIKSYHWALKGNIWGMIVTIQFTIFCLPVTWGYLNKNNNNKNITVISPVCRSETCSLILR
jgi:hypothetical protein